MREWSFLELHWGRYKNTYKKVKKYHDFCKEPTYFQPSHWLNVPTWIPILKSGQNLRKGDEYQCTETLKWLFNLVVGHVEALSSCWPCMPFVEFARFASDGPVNNFIWKLSLIRSHRSWNGNGVKIGSQFYNFFLLFFCDFFLPVSLKKIITICQIFPKSLQISEQILVCGLVIVTYQDQISSKNPLNYKGVQAAPLESLALGNPTSAASHLGIHKKSGDEQAVA